jgi:hypothetical protein
VAYPLVGIRMKDDHTLYVYDRTTFDRYDIDTLLDKDVANHLRKNPWAADPDDLAHDADDGFWTLCPDDADDLATMLSSDDKHLAAERQQGRWRVASTRRAMDGKYYTLAEFQLHYGDTTGLRIWDEKKQDSFHSGVPPLAGRFTNAMQHCVTTEPPTVNEPGPEIESASEEFVPASATWPTPATDRPSCQVMLKAVIDPLLCVCGTKPVIDSTSVCAYCSFGICPDTVSEMWW